MKGTRMRVALCFSLVFGFISQNGQAQENLEFWPYIEKAAAQDQHDRDVEGVSYLVGGATAIALPFVFTSPGSSLRDVGTYTLVPAGVFSILYGSYELITDSPWMTLKKKVVRLSGPKEETVQWQLRRERHARQLLLERADSARFWRYFWGGLEAGAGITLIATTRSAGSIVPAGLLFGLSAYHFLHRKADERIFDQNDQTSVGLMPDRSVVLAHRIYF